ncbi:histidine--tRNA ligase [Paenibacillus wynnii]|uniref:histidine--tRNA ligase n=1 Tax=Paenibacillus wynnii TaxID=268407 RepID=UPI0027902416|nr:ATP phosphoribosyltransferase regulatory subunit [Paenibacillus wynnii]MDQ0194460.1 histidyl-tRNA synthetase [Paenibacillus wynnii]
MQLNVRERELSIPAGTKDILGADMRAREFIIKVIKNNYEKFGFNPHQTPILEYWDTFRGHHGEGEKLFFHIKDTFGRELIPRYDLTVPLARVVCMNPELPKPYKRYQIGPSFRDDEPGTSHFREFTQCDADIIGTHSLLAEAEITIMAHSILSELNITNTSLRVNHRLIIKGLAQKSGMSTEEEYLAFQQALDYIDKVTKGRLDGLKQRFLKNKITDTIAQKLIDSLGYLILETEKTTDPIVQLNIIKSYFSGNHLAEKGIAELEEIMSYLPAHMLSQIKVDLTLARGANYYTGFILEGVANDLGIGAIIGGGRYDTLVSAIGGIDEPAVGLAIGLERIVLVMDKLKCIEDQLLLNPKILLIKNKLSKPSEALLIARKLREYCDVDFYYDESSLYQCKEYARAHGYPVMLEMGAEDSIIIHDVIDNSQFTETVRSILNNEGLVD